MVSVDRRVTVRTGAPDRSANEAALAEVDAGLASGVYPIPEASHRRQARAGGRPPATRAPASEARDGGPARDSNGQGPGTARGGDDD